MNSNNKKTILLVEDEAIIALATGKYLERYGYSIIMANSGEKAFRLFSESNNIDLVLMDIDLGEGIDGPETAKLILAKHDIPVVFLSSHTEPEIVEKTEKITSYGYVVKNSGITVLDASIKMAFKLFDANRKILESELKQKTMISNISDVITITDADGIIRYKSPNIVNLFGWTPEDLVGTDSYLLIHPDDVKNVKNVFSSIFENDNSSITVEYRFRCKDANYKKIELTAINLISNSIINGILMSYHDITGRSRLEEEIRAKNDELAQMNFKLTATNEELTAIIEENIAATEQLLRAESELLESQYLLQETGHITHTGGWMWDLTTDKVSWTDETYSIFGVNPENYTPSFKGNARYIHPDDLEQYGKLFQHSIDSGEPLSFDVRIIADDGTLKYCHAGGHIKKDIHGKKVRFYGSLQDLSERKLLEDMLKKFPHELKVRNKELECIYSVIKTVCNTEYSTYDTLQRIAGALTQAYLYPEITVCRIMLNGVEFKTDNFRMTRWSQTDTITVNGNEAGAIEVCYLEERPDESEGPFLAEERKLVHAISELIGKSIERKKITAHP